MKAKHSVWKNKLVKTTLFMTVILVAALFLGSAASAGLTPQTTPTITTKNIRYDKASYTESPQSKIVTSAPRPIDPRGDIIFSQTYYLPEEPWVFYTSDSNLGWYVQEDFWDLPDEIGDIEWYGLCFDWNQYIPGDPTGMIYNIIFYEDVGGYPGAEVAAFYDITAEFVDTGYGYSSWGEMWLWTFVLPDSVPLTPGWVGIQNTYCPDGSSFMWAAGPEGNWNGLQNGYSVGANFAYTLTAPDVQLEYDVGVSKIKAPVSGDAAIITPEVTVKNYGNYSEYFDVSMAIGKKSYTMYLEEHFESDFPPAGWTVEAFLGDPWQRNDYWGRANMAGTGYCADADMQMSMQAPMLTMMYSPSFDLSGVTGAGLKWNAYEYFYYYDYAQVAISADGGSTWDELWKFTNAYQMGFKQREVDLSDYCGYTDLQLRFLYLAPMNWLYYWEVDDISVYTYEWLVDYPTTYQYVYVPAGQILNVTFPAWTPTDMGVSENTLVEYLAEAQTYLYTDMKENNNYKSKEFDLWYGWQHDIGIVEITSPKSGVAEAITPQVKLANYGQNTESVNVNMVIGKITSPEQILYEDFASGVFPPGWGTTHPSNWMIDPYYNYAGGVAPEVVFNYYPSSVDDFRFYTGPIDTTLYPSLLLEFKEYVNDYNGDYTLKIQTSVDGISWTDAYVRDGGFYGPATTEVAITGGSPTLQIGWTYSGDSYNINYWYLDDIALNSLPLVTEYDHTEVVDINPGETIDVIFSEVWVPEDYPDLYGIDYVAQASATLNGFTSLMTADFSAWPDGWTQSSPEAWSQLYSNYAGGTSPEAWMYWLYTYDGAWFMSPAVDTTSVDTLSLSFKSFVDDYNYYQDYSCIVETRSDASDSWTDRTPWTNPVYGNQGPATYVVDISDDIGTATQVMFLFTGYYFDIDNWYIDDVQIGTVGVIPDSNPSNNVLSKMFTLSYEHDVGVSMITQPSGPAGKDDIIWDNGMYDTASVGLSSQYDTSYPFQSQVADDFQFADDMQVTDVHWWGVFWNGVGENPCDFNIIFYADDGTGNMPTGAGMEDPTSTALEVYEFVDVLGIVSGSVYEYDVTLPVPFFANAGEKYWVAIQADMLFTSYGQFGWQTNGNNPEQLHTSLQGFPLLGTPYWTDHTYGDMAFYLTGLSGPTPGNWPPGTYPVQGVIENFGVTFTESNFDVNTVVTNATGVVVYEDTQTVVGDLAPEASVLVDFIDITIPDVPSAEGQYTLTMKTLLVGDDHTNNDKKTLKFTIERPDIYPPVTTATVEGTMGQNGWYISNPTVTLSAIDPDGKWPSGVNHTYYKIDNAADWTEYTTPFPVTGDGTHVVHYYSVDKAGNKEAEKATPEFKQDTTAPEWIEYTFTATNAMKTKWLCSANVVDPTSGIVVVEFYVDDALVGNDTTGPAPYEFEFSGKPETNSQALAYDAAGNSALSPIASYVEYSAQQQSSPFTQTMKKLV